MWVPLELLAEARLNSMQSDVHSTFPGKHPGEAQMTQLSISKELREDTLLWRYMSLDKLIDFLATQELHFTPLASFATSDPFEGYLPAVAMEADASIFRPKVNDAEATWQLVEDHRKNIGHELTKDERNLFLKQLSELKEAPRLYHAAIAKSIAINCWHINTGESEAMWRLYSDSGKGVAIETTLGALKDSISAGKSAHRVHIYPVKYLDFFDERLKPTDCIVEGHRAPLLKRLSYEHEREVRAFIVRVPETARAALDLESWKPVPVRTPVNVSRLVKAVHVSPYPAEPFASSVTRICEQFGLSEEIIKPSRLLSGHEELLDRFLL
jgi:hypothetical protein